MMSVRNTTEESMDQIEQLEDELRQIDARRTLIIEGGRALDRQLEQAKASLERVREQIRTEAILQRTSGDTPTTDYANDEEGLVSEIETITNKRRHEQQVNEAALAQLDGQRTDLYVKIFTLRRDRAVRAGQEAAERLEPAAQVLVGILQEVAAADTELMQLWNEVNREGLSDRVVIRYGYSQPFNNPASQFEQRSVGEALAMIREDRRIDALRAQQAERERMLAA